MKRFFKKRKKLKIALLVLMLLFIIGCIVANHYAKKYGYRNIWDFVTTVSHNYSQGRDAKFETLEIEIDEADYKKLESTRAKALKRGILVDEEGSFVDAKLKHKGKKIAAKIRLKGHMTDHLQEDKWSFRVVTKKNDAFMGMKRFSLQHPGTRNYIYEWIYHQMMKQEGIISLRYQFIKLKVNKKSWGIYALEEHFAQQLVENNERVKGPLIRFNPELYWTYRINELKKMNIDQEFTKFQSAYVEAYDDNETYKDSALLNRYAKAVMLMEGFRRGELTTSQVFDIQKLAKFHAIVDLVGGHHSLDWSDVKYYYNNVTNKLEPVAYESFSIRSTTSLAGSYRYSGNKQAYITDLHTALFSDPEFFALYISELERIASKKWLDKFLKSIKKPLQNNLATMYKEYPYKKYSPADYYKNIKQIGQILDATKGFHAFVNRTTSDSIYIDLGGIDALPYEVLSIQLDSIKILPVKKIIVPAKAQNAYVHYATYAWPLPTKFSVTISANSDLSVTYRLLGKKDESKEALIVPVPAYQHNLAHRQVSKTKPNVEQFAFARVNASVKEIRMMPGNHLLSETMVIPAGYKVYITEGTTFDLTHAAGIVSYSPVFIAGTEELPVTFTSSDSSGNGLTLLQTTQRSKISSTHFLRQGHAKGSGNGLTLYEADADLSSIAFVSGTSGLHLIRSSVIVRRITFDGLKNQALEADYAKLDVQNATFLNLHNDGIAAKGSALKLTGCTFSEIGAKALFAEGNTQVTATNIKISGARLAVESKDASKVEISKISVTGCTLGFKASKKGDIYGPASITVSGLTENNNKTLQEAEKKSVITIKK